MIAFDFSRLKALRRAHHLKQSELGALLCCTGQCISRAELGLSEVTVADLARIANVYGIEDMNQFFTERVGKANE